MSGPYRVVVAKPGLDGHDRGAKVIARALRDSGFEVIYTGLHQTPEQVVQAVVQEDADAVGLSRVHVARTLESLRDRRLAEIQDSTLVIFDRPRLTELAGYVPTTTVPGRRALL